ncbi:MAG: DUF58 domain-containing protein [Mariniblastus sp.]
MEQIFDILINRPILLLVLLAVPLFAIARLLGLFPSRRLLYLASVPAALSIFLVHDPTAGATVAGLPYKQWMLVLIGIVDVVIVLICVGDMCFVIRPKNFSCTRQLMRTASQGKPHDVEIELINRSKRGCLVSVQDDLPQSFEANPDRFQTVLDGRSKTQFNYDFVCTTRGQSELECVHLLVNSPLRLWRGFYQIPYQSTVNVYPDMKQIAEYDLLARTNRLSLLGMRRSRKIGQDNEFERLRDYTQDDNYKHIDWRSTARRKKLTVRDFQANQSQSIIFMVDCGRMMTGTSGDISLLDHSLNAMLMLSYVALRQGDSVGMISFSNKIHNFTPARSGVKHINRLLHASYNQHAEYVESRYDDAFLYLRSHCRKRSLVVLVTNVIDEINAHQLKQYMGSLTGRHLPLGVLLRDQEIYGAIDEYNEMQTPNDSTIYQAAAAADVLGWRHQVIRDLKHQGVLALDLFPEQLTSELVNQYLEIKARHLL